jgi:D-glycero-alpha-D-manno-heptose-7-phosphate kinase
MLIISRTPLRVSLFGGGTDYPEYYVERRGSVLGLAIDKYIYIAALKLSGIQSYQYRIAYSRVEHVDSVAEIQHNAVKAAFEHYGIACPVDLSVMADMPANSGLGSSSSFSVGLLNLIAHLKGQQVTKLDLALNAIHLERELLKENVGVQDQLHAAFGGINRFDLDGKNYRITPMMMRGECLNQLMQSLVLIHTGVSRHASAVVSEQLQRTRSGAIDRQLDAMLSMVDQACDILTSSRPDSMLRELGAMLNDSWMLKRTLSPMVSTAEIDALYEKAVALGALGGKLCGAGGGGFLLMIVPPRSRDSFILAMAPARVISIGLDTQGSTIIYS